MQKILNYIIKGQGIGIKFILLASFIISLIFSLFIRINGAELVPYANDVINQMLPLKIENGVVVSPQNTIRVAHLQSGNVAIPLPIIMDTTIDEIDPTQVEKGVYLTRTKFYIINENEVKMYPLEEDVELIQDDYTGDIKSVLNWMAISIFLIGILFIFITYFIAAIFFALCAQIIELALHKKYNFDLRMRLSVICFLSVYIFYFLLSLCGIESGKLILFITTIIVQTAIIYKLPIIKSEIVIEEKNWPMESSTSEAKENLQEETEKSSQVKTIKKATKKTIKTKTNNRSEKKKTPLKKKTTTKKKTEK